MSKELEADINDLLQSIGQIIRRVRANSGEEELSISEAMVLRRLAVDGPATTADLARAEGMKPQSMGAIVAVLEEAGLVKRKADPADGRRMHLHITPRGLASRESRRAAKRTWLAEAIGALSREEQAALFRASALLKRLAEQ